jgi:GNAT superfamily N-acetyltransferase
VGWIDVGIVHHLQTGAKAEIGGLIVAAGRRGLGIGRTLVEAAERWAAEQGLGDLVVRSQIKREAAHKFYLDLGYERVKTSAVFSKTLLNGHQL